MRDTEHVIHVRVYGSHRRMFPQGEETTVDYVANETLKGLLSRLNVPGDEVGVLVVNDALVSPEFILSPGDRVAIMSPVSGG